MNRKLAILVVVLAAGCGQAFKAAPRGSIDGGPDAPEGDSGDSGEPADAGTGADGSPIADGAVDASADATGVDATGDAKEAGGDTGSEDAGTDGGSWSPVCPVDAPTVGSACSLAGLQCEYPRSALYADKLQYDVTCDILRACTSGAWASVSFGGMTCAPDGPNSTMCPATLDKVLKGGTCPDNGLRCEYAAGVCSCAPNLGGPVTRSDAGASWSCNPGSGCPMPRPRLGSACATAGQMCTYETCAYEEICQEGIWQGEEEACEQPGSSP
jgi:hypothetical protein